MSLTKDDKAILRVYNESAKNGKSMLSIHEAMKTASVTKDPSHLICAGYLTKSRPGTSDFAITPLGRKEIKPWYAQPWHVWVIIALAAIATVASVVAVLR